jgi:hypothetical protein
LVAFLEQILLDDDGNIRPQYSEEAVSNRNLPNGNVQHSVGNAAVPHQEGNRTIDDVHDQWPSDQPDTPHNEQEEPSRASNPLKRKFSGAYSESWLLPSDDFDLSQHLPDQPILAKIAEFFCVSFHHWRPYLHKQRLQTRVREGPRDAGFELFLHALVAVALRHMSPNTVLLDKDQVRKQIAISQSIVEVQSIRHVSVESLQALILVVFDHVSVTEVSSSTNGN